MGKYANPKDDFTKAELAELFGNGSRRPRLRRRLDKRAMARSDAPLLADPKDPAFVKSAPPKDNRGKSIKYLTIKKRPGIIGRVIKRKDGKVATKKQTLTYKQTGSVALLTIAAVVGITELLGGGVKDAFVAALLCALLFAYALGE